MTRRPRRAAAVALAAVVLTALAAPGLTTPTDAAWSDGVTATSTISTTTVPAPTGLGCPSLGLLSSYIYWTAVPGATRYDIYVGAAYQGSTTSTSYGAGFLLSNTTYTVVTNVNGWQSPSTSRITITVVLILVSCSATA